MNYPTSEHRWLSVAEIEALKARIAELEAALQAFVEAWEKSHQLEKTDVALRMARKALEKSE